MRPRPWRPCLTGGPSRRCGSPAHARAPGPSRALPHARCDARATVYDRHHDFSASRVDRAGKLYFRDRSADEFLRQARTYGGVGFWKRMAILVAGVACNIVLLVASDDGLLHAGRRSHCDGYRRPCGRGGRGVPCEEQAGLVPGDEIVSIGGVPVDACRGCRQRPLRQPGATARSSSSTCAMVEANGRRSDSRRGGGPWRQLHVHGRGRALKPARIPGIRVPLHRRGGPFGRVAAYPRACRRGAPGLGGRGDCGPCPGRRGPGHLARRFSSRRCSRCRSGG